ncbi:MAG: fatty acyl-AMP ligase [Anaerolineales bacterium]
MPLPPPTTLVESLRRAVSGFPNNEAFVFLQDGEVESTRLTFAELDGQARAIAARLRSIAAPGETVILLYGAGLEGIPAFFGCLYAGMIAVPVIPPRPNQPGDFAGIIANARPKVGLTTESSLAKLRQQHADAAFFQALPWLATDIISGSGQGDAALETFVDPAPDDVAALIYTSGSTSLPKGVMLTHKSLLGQPLNASGWLDPDTRLAAVSWMPMYHIAGLFSLVLSPNFPTVTTYVLPAESVVERPLRWLQAISRYQALTSGGPNFLYQLCVDRVAPEERVGLNLEMWFFASLVAEPIRAETVEAFVEAYAPFGFRREAFIPGYGLSEASQGVASPGFGSPVVIRAFDRQALAQGQAIPVEAGAEGSQKLVSCGRQSPMMDVRIVDPATRLVCPPSKIGEIWAASEFLSRGYWQRPAETEETFGGYLAGTGEGPFLRTGDLGFVCDGELYISGRLKEIIIIRGRKYHAQDIEAAAAGSHPDLGSAAAAFSVPAEGGTEQVVIYHEVRPDCPAPDVEAVSAAIRRAVARAMQLPVYAVALVQAGTLPRTSVGKIQRYLCREEFLAAQGAQTESSPRG